MIPRLGSISQEFSLHDTEVRKRKDQGRKEVYFKEVVLVIVDTGKSKICRVGWQIGDPG